MWQILTRHLHRFGPFKGPNRRSPAAGAAGDTGMRSGLSGTDNPAPGHGNAPGIGANGFPPQVLSPPTRIDEPP